jgi:hypothetical protein
MHRIGKNPLHLLKIGNTRPHVGKVGFGKLAHLLRD